MQIHSASICMQLKRGSSNVSPIGIHDFRSQNIFSKTGSRIIP
ncbi:hypothetical protein MNBD_ALPHA11-1998 [hydrothermal vent metagenome]|uniref:Uncharacterized protein n=1 Tax=hydrothermal vent metagenome TaxID=652676 RepID=A0A3B0UAW6_9ZZZZ